jgi:hypothetical protein
MAKSANGVPGPAKAAGAVPSGKDKALRSAPAGEARARPPQRKVAPAPPAAAAPVHAKRAVAPRAATLKPPARPPKPAIPAARPALPDPALSEEEKVLDAKYLPRELPPRVFEEERFVFPQSYGVNRVRLLVKDPHWLFAHWDVDSRVREQLRGEKGERFAALARLTLRLVDKGAAGHAIVLPEGARSWYLRAAPGHRSYEVELGLTLPSGEYRSLARSNAVSTPRVGPAPEKATRRASYRVAASLPPSASLPASGGGSGPITAAAPAGAEKAAGGPAPASAFPSAEPVHASEPSPGPEPGGASDLFRR